MSYSVLSGLGMWRRALPSLVAPLRSQPNSVASSLARRSLSTGGVGAGFSFPAPRRLDDIVKLDLFRPEPAEKIEEIWKQFHASKEFLVSDVWSREDFEQFQASAKQGALFIFPVPRENGHFIVVSQVQDKHVLFTYLEDYKTNPAGAQPYFVLSFYVELAAEKDVVLVRGDVTPAALTHMEGVKLLALVREFYLDKVDEVAAFNRGSFDFEKHVNDILTRPS